MINLLINLSGAHLHGVASTINAITNKSILSYSPCHTCIILKGVKSTHSKSPPPRLNVSWWINFLPRGGRDVCRTVRSFVCVWAAKRIVLHHLIFLNSKWKKKNRKSNKNYGVQSTIALNFLSAAAAHFTRAASSVAPQPNNAVWLLKYLNHEMYIFRMGFIRELNWSRIGFAVMMLRACQ